MKSFIKSKQMLLLVLISWLMQGEKLLDPSNNWPRHQNRTLWIAASLHHSQAFTLLTNLSNQLSRKAHTNRVAALSAFKLHLDRLKRLLLENYVFPSLSPLGTLFTRSLSFFFFLRFLFIMDCSDVLVQDSLVLK